MLLEWACCLKLLAAVVAVVVVGASLVALYAKITCGVCKSTKNMKGKTVIITGATSGEFMHVYYPKPHTNNINFARRHWQGNSPRLGQERRSSHFGVQDSQRR